MRIALRSWESTHIYAYDDCMSWSEPIVRLAQPGDARSIAEVHVESWKTTYQGIFPDTFLNSLSVEKRDQFWRETLMMPEPHSTTLVGCVLGPTKLWGSYLVAKREQASWSVTASFMQFTCY
jgi:hypothetical protein